jgi:hypothetical protein
VQFLHGTDDKLRDYLRRNGISVNVLEDDGKDIMELTNAKFLELIESESQKVSEEQPTWMSFADAE